MSVVLESLDTTSGSLEATSGSLSGEETQLTIALRRILSEADNVDPQAPVACFNSAF